MNYIHNMSSEITLLKLEPHLPGANELRYDMAFIEPMYHNTSNGTYYCPSFLCIIWSPFLPVPLLCHCFTRISILLLCTVGAGNWFPIRQITEIAYYMNYRPGLKMANGWQQLMIFWISYIMNTFNEYKCVFALFTLKLWLGHPYCQGIVTVSAVCFFDSLSVDLSVCISTPQY